MEFLIIREIGDKRFIKRIFKRTNNKKDMVDYCMQSKIFVNNDERWINVYYNNSKTKVERRFLEL